MKLQYLGHACFYIEMNGSTLLIDPFISGNPLAADINLNDIKADYILLTHGHEDHVADVEYIAKNHPTTLISNFEIVSWFGKKEINGHPMNFGGKKSFDFGTVKYVQAIHSSVLPDGTYGGNPGGFVIWDDDICFYHAGDTSLTYDMKLIPETCPDLDFAILPIGDNFTMGYEDAVLAAGFIQCDRIIACHFDTFGYIEIDHEKAIESFSKANLNLNLMNIGETMEF